MEDARRLAGLIAMLLAACSPDSPRRSADDAPVPRATPAVRDSDPMLGTWAVDEAGCRANPVVVTASSAPGDLYLLRRAGLSCLLGATPVGIAGTFDFPARCRVSGRQRAIGGVLFDLHDPEHMTLRHPEPAAPETLHRCAARAHQ